LKTAARLSLIVLIFAAAVFFQLQTPKVTVSREFLKPPENIKYFTFGYNDFLASSLWLRLLQNFEYCEGGKFQESDYVAPTKEAKDKLEGILIRQMKPSKCHLGWVYSMLDVISEIQPRFRLVYETGAIFLSVAVDDREGARRIFEKGAVQYPKDWELLFRAGYHYMWEMQNPQRAAELYRQAASAGAPDYVIALSAALYSRVGQARIAKIMLEDAVQKKPSSVHIDRIKTRLDEVNKILEENK